MTAGDQENLKNYYWKIKLKVALKRLSGLEEGALQITDTEKAVMRKDNRGEPLNESKKKLRSLYRAKCTLAQARKKAGLVPQEQWRDPGNFDYVYDTTFTKAEKGAASKSRNNILLTEEEQKHLSSYNWKIRLKGALKKLSGLEEGSLQITDQERAVISKAGRGERLEDNEKKLRILYQAKGVLAQARGKAGLVSPSGFSQEPAKQEGAAQGGRPWNRTRACPRMPM